MGKQLGEGAFGQVVKAEAVEIGNKKGTTPVAVKMLKCKCRITSIYNDTSFILMPGNNFWNETK